MLKSLVQKIHDVPGSVWFLAFAIAIIGGQLFALAWLADGQVQRANVRDRAASENSVALAQCFEHKSAERMSQCATGGVSGTTMSRSATTESPMSAEQFIAQYTSGNSSAGTSGRVQSAGVRQVAFVR